eukprot:Pgem_evm1s15206
MNIKIMISIKISVKISIKSNSLKGLILLRNQWDNVDFLKTWVALPNIESIWLKMTDHPLPIGFLSEFQKLIYLRGNFLYNEEV